ncbi:hypothetical protein [Ileibacterium valens]|uniref:hypothetical protein n=1 Tax=Ileibacterium valens TaxID=1862668 RepID=UPI00272AAA74|nr:hypothetical protein [Ileibacterium valens]
MSSKFKDLIANLKDKKEVEFGKEVRLEKDDYKALLIACFQIFMPVLLGMLAVFALLILIIVAIWN